MLNKHSALAGLLAGLLLILPACSKGSATPVPPSEGSTKGDPAPSGPATAKAYGQGGWELSVPGRGWYHEWVPGQGLYVQTGVNAAGVIQGFDPKSGNLKPWPGKPAHMLVSVSPSGMAAWPESSGGKMQVMVARAGEPGKPVVTLDDVYQIAWLDADSLVVEGPAGASLVSLQAGASPKEFPGQHLMGAGGGAALLSSKNTQNVAALLTAKGVVKELPNSTQFAQLSIDGTRMLWAPYVTPPTTPTTSWLEPRVAYAHGAVAAFAKELRLVNVTTGKEIAIAMPRAAFIDAASWHPNGHKFAVAVHTDIGQGGVARGGAVLVIDDSGKLTRFDPGSDFFELAGFIGDDVVVFTPDPKDQSMSRAVLLRPGSRTDVLNNPVQYVDDPLAPYLTFADPTKVIFMERQGGKRVTISRKDLPTGTEAYPPELSQDHKWVVMRAANKLYVLPVASFGAS